VTDANFWALVQFNAEAEIESVLRKQPNICVPKDGVHKLMVFAYMRGATFMQKKLEADGKANGPSAGEQHNG
jgi:hypothetical protein